VHFLAGCGYPDGIVKLHFFTKVSTAGMLLALASPVRWLSA
jgi:hypothetical protein